MDNYKVCKEYNKHVVVNFLSSILPFNYTLDIFNWEYGHKKKVFHVICDRQNKVLGAQGMIPIPLNYKGKRCLSAKSETSYLHHSVQGKGLFKKLYSSVVDEAFNNDIELIWGITSLGNVWKKLGFETFNNCLYVYSLSIRPNTKIFIEEPNNSKVINTLKYLKSFVNSIKLRIKLILYKKIKLNDYHYTSTLINENDIITLHSNVLANDIRVEMNKTYRNYRINNNPFLKYKHIYIYHNNSLEGYAIYSKSNGTASLVDVCSKNINIKKALINSVIKSLRKDKSINKLNVFGNIYNKHIKDTFSIFKKYGALSYDTKQYLVLLTKNKEDIKKWYINGLWTEGVHQ